SVVMPATIDTPLFQHAGNYTGRVPIAMPPVYPPERVARTIVRLARTPRREVYVGSSASQLALLSFLAPGFTERWLARTVDRLHLQHGRIAYATNGNLFTPLVEGTTVNGGWKPRGRNRLLRAADIGLAALAPAMLGL